MNEISAVLLSTEAAFDRGSREETLDHSSAKATKQRLRDLAVLRACEGQAVERGFGCAASDRSRSCAAAAKRCTIRTQMCRELAAEQGIKSESLSLSD